MGTPSDTLVAKFPTREKQLRGPVHDYLSQWAPFKGTDQDLYMAIFYPAARKWPATKELPKYVQKANKGIKTSQDYITRVNAQKNYAELSASEWTALKDVAKDLGLSWQSLFKQINFESGWNPKAHNKASGARGLIQFIPSTSKALGFKGTFDVKPVLMLVAGIYVFNFVKNA